MRQVPRKVLAIALLPLLMSTPLWAQAQKSADDRLREQLRSTMQQLRGYAEDNARLKAELQQLKDAPPKVDTSEVDRLSRQLNAEQANRRQSQGQATDLQQRLDGVTLELKAERENRQKALEQALGSDTRETQAQKALDQCQASNAALVAISQDLLERYRDRGVFDALLAREPLTQLRKAQLERLSEDYGQRIDEQTTRSSNRSAP